MIIDRENHQIGLPFETVDKIIDVGYYLTMTVDYSISWSVHSKTIYCYSEDALLECILKLSGGVDNIPEID